MEQIRFVLVGCMRLNVIGGIAQNAIELARAIIHARVVDYPGDRKHLNALVSIRNILYLTVRVSRIRGTR